jgi:hypothetical protein
LNIFRENEKIAALGRKGLRKLGELLAAGQIQPYQFGQAFVIASRRDGL